MAKKRDKFNEAEIEHIEDDIDKIRVRTGMYISYKGSKGALHLDRELTNNMIDEERSVTKYIATHMRSFLRMVF